LTWANLVTVVRLLLLPVFVWILFTTDHRAIAAWLLAFLGATDWIDGFLARRLHQVSTVGKIIDPVADRLLVVVGLLSVAAASGVPWWFALTTLAREVIVSVLTLVLAGLGAARIDVLWWGKVSTFALMTAYPWFLLTTNPHHGALAQWQHVGDRHHGSQPLVAGAGGLRATRPRRAARRAPGQANLVDFLVMQIPSELRYSNDHEWAKADGAVVRIGITDYAQDALGDVVFVDLPKLGSTLNAGEALGEIESTKSVSEIYAPVSGTVTAVNDSLTNAPESVNADPYGVGWICEITTTSSTEYDALLDEQGYQALTNN
jgi:glycine cleavage system H protein